MSEGTDSVIYAFFAGAGLVAMFVIFAIGCFITDTHRRKP